MKISAVIQLYHAVILRYGICNADGDLTPDLDSKSISQFDFDFYSAMIFDVDTNTLYLYKYSAS